MHRKYFPPSPVQRRSFLNQNTLWSVHSLAAIFNFCFYCRKRQQKIKVLPRNMVDIFCTYCNCNVYNFISFFFFTKRSFVTFVYLIFCFVVFNSSGNKLHSFTNTCIPNVIDPCNLLLYQVVLSFFSDIIVFCFIKF